METPKGYQQDKLETVAIWIAGITITLIIVYFIIHFGVYLLGYYG